MKVPQNSKTRIPSFPFYPSDWKADNELQSCSLEARGLWIEMMGIMHNSSRYGYLEINNKKPSDKAIAKLVGSDSVEEYQKVLQELMVAGVPRTEENTGIIFCKRMVKDNELRELRRKTGSKGGNPNIVIHNTEEENEGELGNEKEDDKKDITVNGKIYFDFEKRKFENIKKQDIKDWQKTYPACNIFRELRKMKDWLLSNPDRKKKNYRRFISNWLTNTRTQTQESEDTKERKKYGKYSRIQSPKLTRDQIEENKKKAGAMGEALAKGMQMPKEEK